MEMMQIAIYATLVGLIALLVVSSVIALRSRSGPGSLWSANAELKTDIEQKNADLLDARAAAEKFSGLAEDRKTEIERLNGDLSKLRVKLDEAASEKNKMTGIISSLETELKAVRKASEQKIEDERAKAEEILAAAKETREKMEAQFKEIARDAIKIQGEDFSKTNMERLTALLTPFKGNVERFEKEIKNLHNESVKERERLKSEIRNLSSRSEKISDEAVALTRALRADSQKRGAWGEMILENILESSGLRKGEEYEVQAHREGLEGERLRPDAVVNLPGGKTLVVDSKVSLVDYTDAVNAETEEEAALARKRHVFSMRNHINVLSGKGYQTAENESVDYVVMFVPIEGALSEALREEGSLTEYALERQVTIATPTTLMMALKTAANVWAVERRSRNAEEIATRAGLLYDKVAGFVNTMEDVGKRLNQATEAHSKAFNQLSRGKGNLLSQTETLKRLGARTGKQIGQDFDGRDEVPALQAGE